MKKYSLILCDAPWRYDNQQQNDPARGGITYPTMTMEDLYNLPMYKCVNDNSVLVFWVTFTKLMDQYYEKYDPLSIVRNWGFRPVTALFIWIKLNKNAIIYPYGDIDFGMSSPHWEEDKTDANYYEHIKCADLYSGLGHYTNSNAEMAIVARRGKGLPRINKNVKQLIFAPIGSHSAKPQVQYKRLWNLYGDVPRVELFARDINPPPYGWDGVGLEYTPSTDIRDWIRKYD